MKNNWWKKNWKWVLPLSFLVGIITVVLGVKVLLDISLKSNWVYQEAIKRVKDNESIKKLIGEDVKEGFFIQGNLNTVKGSGDLSGDAYLAIPISGSKGNGTVYVMASRSKENWFFEVLEVEISSKKERVYLIKNRQKLIDKGRKCPSSQSQELTQEDSELLMREAMGKYFVILLEKECFQELNQLAENYRINDEKTYSGRLKSAVFYQGIYNLTSVLDPSEQESWNKLRHKVLRWTDAYPQHQDIYFEAAFYLLPEWYGSFQAVEDLANYAVQKTQDSEGFEMYTRIYWFIGALSYSYRGRKLFDNSLVDWNKMKLGMDDILERYPAQWNINNFAYFSCLAGDKEKTKNLLNRMEEIVPVVWEEAEPYGINLEYCRNLGVEED